MVRCIPPIMARLLSHKLHSWAKYTVGEKEKNPHSCANRHVLEKMLWWCGTVTSSDTNSPSRQIRQVEKVILEWVIEHTAFFGAGQGEIDCGSR